GVTVSLCEQVDGDRVLHGVSGDGVASAGYDDYAAAMRAAEQAIAAAGGPVHQVANLNGRFFDFVPAIQLEAGMTLMAADGSTDTITSLRRLPGEGRRVHDIDVFPTHNYVAAGIVTHNSIYRFRGA